MQPAIKWVTRPFVAYLACKGCQGLASRQMLHMREPSGEKLGLKRATKQSGEIPDRQTD
jgi:hypothetical protein